jgi:hypothetical protein
MTMPMIVRISEAIAKITFLLNFMKSRLFEWFDFAEFFRLYARTAKLRNNLLAFRTWLMYSAEKSLLQPLLAYAPQTL